MCLESRKESTLNLQQFIEQKVFWTTIQLDLWGPARNISKGGARYMVTFVDDYSRKVWVYFLNNKSDVFLTFKQWKVLIEKQTGKQVKWLRTVNGLEFCNDEFNEFCKNEEIARHLTIG